MVADTNFKEDTANMLLNNTNNIPLGTPDDFLKRKMEKWEAEGGLNALRGKEPQLTRAVFEVTDAAAEKVDASKTLADMFDGYLEMALAMNSVKHACVNHPYDKQKLRLVAKELAVNAIRFMVDCCTEVIEIEPSVLETASAVSEEIPGETTFVLEVNAGEYPDSYTRRVYEQHETDKT